MPESYLPEPHKPRLIWSGRQQTHVSEALPFQVVEVVHPNQEAVNQVNGQLRQGRLDLASTFRERLGSKAGASCIPDNRLIWTNDNLVALTSLIKGSSQYPSLEGQVNLIYIDPPFAIQNDFTISIEIDEGATDEKQPTLIEELAYRDTWKNGLDSYLSMMRDRLELLKRLLAPKGSIYVHCDWRAGHYLKVLMDEIFGYENYRNDIAWRRDAAGKGAKRISNQWPRNSDRILFYVKDAKLAKFEQQYVGLSDEQKRVYRYRDPDGRMFKAVQLGDYSPASIARMADENLIYTSESGAKYKKYYLDEAVSTLDEIWVDVFGFGVRTASSELVGFPTQKPVALLQRIIAASSSPGDIVLDAFAGSGTTAVAAETMKDADGKLAPRRWIAVDCSKFAVHITRKRLIEANARPFSVENVGFFTRADEWRDLWAEQPAAKVYRDALVEIYGGIPVEGYAHLHGRKGNHWVHVGPLDAPVSTIQVRAIAEEAAATDRRAVDILSADIPIDWDRSAAEHDHGVAVYAKVIPQAAVDAVRERGRRLQRRDPNLAEPPAIHFFSPPDVEVRVRVHEDTATVVLTRLTVDLDDCLATQDAARRAEIKRRITDWKALIDYWAVDWDWQEGDPFQNDWQAFRTRKHRQFPSEATHSYGNARGEHRVAVKVTDIFGNDGLRVVHVSV